MYRLCAVIANEFIPQSDPAGLTVAFHFLGFTRAVGSAIKGSSGQ